MGVRAVAGAVAVAAFAVSGTVTGAATTTPPLHFQDYNVPGALWTILVGINDQGVVAGKYWDQAENAHVFIGAGSVITTFNVPGEPGAPASGVPLLSGVNDTRDVAGVYSDANGVYHGYLRSPTGHFTYLDDPQAGAVPNEGEGTFPQSLNDNNDIVGQYVDSQGVGHGFLYHDGAYTTVDIGGATETGVNAINDYGVMIGNYADSSGAYHGFMDSYGHISIINAPAAGKVAGTGTFPYGIAKNGTVVISVVTSSGVDLGWMLKQGRFTALNDPNSVYGPNLGTGPAAIAEDGNAIAGYYNPSADSVHGFIVNL
jgi:hypothetical protein